MATYGKTLALLTQSDAFALKYAGESNDSIRNQDLFWIGSKSVTAEGGRHNVRPVITIKSTLLDDTLASGTSEDPFIIE